MNQPTTKMAPTRIQLKRTKGWRKPENTVVVSRPGRWGNPFAIGMSGEVESAEEAVRLFEDHFAKNILYRAKVTEELRGKNLACWCPTSSPHCHAMVLLKWANE
jgi:hypothetical protein